MLPKEAKRRVSKETCKKMHPSIQKKKAKDIRVEILMLEHGTNRCPNRQQAPSEKRNQESGFLLETTLDGLRWAEP
jgi:hypothetical protein